MGTIKIFKEEKIDEAALELAGYSDFPHTTEQAFRDGVDWAESKIEGIAVEFVTYILQDKLLFSEDLFKQFIKERNNE